MASRNSNMNGRIGPGGRYVPPHLRGRGQSSPTKHHGRWRDFENDNRAKDGGKRWNHNRSNTEASPNHSNAPRGNSRWANVNRSSIEARGSSSYGNRSYNRSSQLQPEIKAIFFGDSFIKLFGLLNEYTDSILKQPRRIEVHKYKAASAKGLCRDHNENRESIQKVVNRLSKRDYPSLKRLVFCFGDVDVHMSYFFKKFVKGDPLTNEDLKQIATDYVDFVAGLEIPPRQENEHEVIQKLIVGIYPSPLLDSDVGSSLKAYGSLETEEQVRAVDASEDRLMTRRQARVDLYNQALKDRIDYHNSTQRNLEYYDVQDDLLKMTTTEDGKDSMVVKDAYRDVSDLNIHLIHETTLQLWVEKWPWYKELTRNDAGGIDNRRFGPKTTIGFLEYLQKTFDEYRKTKPWAERTHVVETMGVQLS